MNKEQKPKRDFGSISITLFIVFRSFRLNFSYLKSKNVGY